MESEPEDRFKGKPFLILLEQYTLWCIGKISEEHRIRLDEITSHLKKTFPGKGDTWQEIIQNVMEYPSDMPERVMKIWMQACSDAKKAGIDAVDPIAFMRSIVDSQLTNI